MSSTRPIVCGVYMLFREQRLIYVGRSRDIYRRVDDHRSNGREFDYAAVTPCPEADAPWIEAAMIKAMEPAQNRTHKPLPVRSTVELRPLPEPAPKPRRPQDLISKKEALRLAVDRRLGRELRAALEAGEIKFAPISHARRGAKGIIYTPTATTYEAVSRWLDAAENARLAHLGLA